MQEEQSGDRPKSRFRQMIGENKRPLIIAAGAIVLTIAVLTILQPFGGRDEPAPAPAPQPTIVEPADPDAFLPPAAPVNGTPADAARLAALPFGAPFMTPIDAGQIDPMAVGAVPVNDVTIAYPMPDEAVGSLRLRTAASSGDPSALYEVGARYAEGRFVATNLPEAAIWFERAADSGLAVAQFRLAEMYEAGQGVTQDRQAAADLYLAAAEQGNVFAMYNLGMLLNQGIDLASPDHAGAVEWLTAAAEHGIRDAQYNLGVIYARGIGVDIDLVASYQWFAIAATQGDTDAAARRDQIAAALTSDQLATARAAVSAWSVAGAPATANTVPVPEGGWDEPDQRVDAGDQEQLVRTIQALLIDRGFDPGPADGVAGPMTYDAVRAFQRMIGVEPTGEINDALLEALNAHA
jgi:localization factor PodJL